MQYNQPQLSTKAKKLIRPVKSRKQQIKHTLVSTNIKSALAGAALMLIFVAFTFGPSVKAQYEYAVAEAVSATIEAARQDERNNAIPRILADTASVTKVCSAWWFGSTAKANTSTGKLSPSRHNPLIAAQRPLPLLPPTNPKKDIKK